MLGVVLSVFAVTRRVLGVVLSVFAVTRLVLGVVLSVFAVTRRVLGVVIFIHSSFFLFSLFLYIYSAILCSRADLLRTLEVERIPK